MPTNLEIAASKFLHPSNSEKFFPHDRDSIQDNGQPFPMVEFLREELDPEYADDNLINPLPSQHYHIMRVITKDSDDYEERYRYIRYIYIHGDITADEFSHYVRVLAEHEAKKQVSENPGTTGKPASETGKLPSQDVNRNTYPSSAESPIRGILSIGFIRRIASKLSANWGSKGKS